MIAENGKRVISADETQSLIERFKRERPEFLRELCDYLPPEQREELNQLEAA